jgi:hypothetical protein
VDLALEIVNEPKARNAICSDSHVHFECLRGIISAIRRLGSPTSKQRIHSVDSRHRFYNISYKLIVILTMLGSVNATTKGWLGTEGVVKLIHRNTFEHHESIQHQQLVRCSLCAIGVSNIHNASNCLIIYSLLILC